MNSLESVLLEFGLNWVFSKIAPYGLILLFSVLLALYQKKWRSKWKWLDWSRIAIIIILPISLYFALNPIYQGDLIDYSEEVEEPYDYPDGTCLNIFVLKGCPYCKKTIPFTSMLLRRNNDWKINYIVLGSKNEYKGFIDEIDPGCKVIFEPNSANIQKITKGNYPTYVLSKNKIGLRKWSNMHFGFRSLDVIENFLDNK